MFNAVRERVLVCTIAGAMALCGAAGAQSTRLRDDLAEALKDVKLGRMEEAHALCGGVIGRLAHIPFGERATETLMALRAVEGIGDADTATRLRDVLEAEGLELYASGFYVPEQDRARRVLACLREARDVDPLTPAARGRCRLTLGENAAAATDLEVACRHKPGDASLRFDLARARWRNGEHARALAVARNGLSLRWQREGVEIVAAYLREQVRAGRVDEARALAAQVRAQAGPRADLSLLARLEAEIHVAAGEIAPALEALHATAPADRAWLMGGLVRAAQARAAESPAQRSAVVAEVDRFLGADRAAPPALLRLSGDLHAEAGEADQALRHYAASITDGFGEGMDLARRFRERSGGAVPAGSVVETFAHAFPALPYAPLDPDAHARTVRLARGILGFPPSKEAGAISPLNLALGAAVEPAMALILFPAVSDDGRPVDVAGLRTLETRGRMQGAGLPRPQRNLIESYVAHDGLAVQDALDGLALASWQSARPGQFANPLPMTTELAGTVARDTTPLATSVAPAAFGLIRITREAVTQPDVPEDERLSRVIESARLNAPVPLVRHDPIAIDLDGNGKIDLTTTPETCVTFDVAGHGRPQRIQWLARGHDGWLCEDKDGDGKITSGDEMFGTAGGYADGFEKLAHRDVNHDGVISGGELDGLSVWIDKNGNGVTDPGELIAVRDAGVESITIPVFGLRSTAVVHGHRRICEDVWPQLWDQLARGRDVLDLEGI